MAGRPRSAAPVLAGMLALVFAACTASPALPAATTQVATASVQFSDSTGAIEGTVLDPEGQPVTHASALLSETEATVTADAGGRFTFNNLEPGTYRVFVSALGYGSSARAVEVIAGVAAPLLFVLEPIAILEPYMTYTAKDGYWSCVLRLYVQNADCSTVTGEKYDGNFDFPVAANYSALFFELTWKPSSQITQPSRASMSFYSFNASTMPGGRPHGVNRSFPPITILVQPGEAPMQPQWTNYPADMTQARVYLIPIGYYDPTPNDHGRYGLGLIYQQRYKVHASFFYDQPFPNGYSGIPDG